MEAVQEIVTFLAGPFFKKNYLTGGVV